MFYQIMQSVTDIKKKPNKIIQQKRKKTTEQKLFISVLRENDAFLKLS